LRLAPKQRFAAALFDPPNNPAAIVAALYII